MWKLIALVAALVPSMGVDAAPVQSVTLGRDVRYASGGCVFNSRPVSIGGKLYDFYLSRAGSKAVTFDVQGYDTFAAFVGIMGEGETNARADAYVELDGERVWERSLRRGDAAARVEVKLTGHKSTDPW